MLTFSNSSTLFLDNLKSDHKKTKGGGVKWKINETKNRIGVRRGGGGWKFRISLWSYLVGTAARGVVEFSKRARHGVDAIILATFTLSLGGGG